MDSPLLPLPWDSDFFRHRLGRLQPAAPAELDRTLSKAKAAGFACLYFNAEAGWDEGLRWAARRRLFPVGLRVILSARTAAARGNQGRTIKTEPGAGAGETLKNLAEEELAPLSRFARDPFFGDGEARRLYRHWAETTLSGQRARAVLFAEAEETKTGGFISLRAAGGEISIDLVAVAPSLRGRGLGRDLLAAALGRAAEEGYARLQVATQGVNIPALGAYGSAGFRIVKIEHCFHIHLGEDGAGPADANGPSSRAQ